MDDVEERRLVAGHVREGVDVEGVIQGQEGDGVVEYAEVGGSVSIFDQGLGLEARAAVQVGQVRKLTPLGLNLHRYQYYFHPNL